MKLRLPLPVRKLFLALQLSILAFASSMNLAHASSPAFTVSSIDIPEGYTELQTSNASSIVSKDGKTDKTAFRLTSDIAISNRTTHLTIGSRGGWAITSDSVKSLAELTLSGNKTSSSVTGNNIKGGAVFGESNSEFMIFALEEAQITGNTSSSSATAYSSKAASANASGGAVYCDTIALSDTGVLLIEKNQATATAKSTLTSSTLTASSNAYGGALYGSMVSLTGIQNLTFNENFSTASSSTSPTNANATARGGAIYGTTISICENDNVSFSNNLVSATTTSSTIGSTRATSSGGAIYASSISVKNNGSVKFEGNEAFSEATSTNANASIVSSASGGAISGSVTLVDNDSVAFNKNAAFSGGAVSGGVTMSENDVVTFDCNIGYESGGAISGSCTANDNTYVSFLKNTTRGEGGAIAGSANFTDNDYVVFSGNNADDGGAVYGSVKLTANDSVTFSDNVASCDGGAIYASKNSNVILSDNVSVTFSGNLALTASAAICGIESYSLTIRNNESVLFERNAIGGDSIGYQLRSLYSINTVSIGAAAEGEVRFNDTVYIYAPLKLNESYTDENASTHTQTGEIVFSGQYAERHLNDLLDAKNAGRQASAEEISASKTSYVYGTTSLHGGSLVVEEGAVLKTLGGLSVTAESNATVRVDDAVIDANREYVSIESGGLELCNGGTVSAVGITIAEVAVLSAMSETPNDSTITAANPVALTLLTHQVPFNVEVGGIISGNLTLVGGSTLAVDGAHIQMGDNSSLTLSKLSNDKIHLSLGALDGYMEGDSILLFSNVSYISGAGSLLSGSVAASSIFDGEWIKEGTTLHFENSNIYIRNINYLSGNIPEPTTATLSLLALAAFASRRRRS